MSDSDNKKRSLLKKHVDNFLDNLQNRGNIEEMFEFLPDIYFYIKDRSCRWIMCNQACLRLCHFRDQSEVYGTMERDVFPSKIAQAIYQDDRNVIDNNQRIVNRTELIVNEIGYLTWVSTNKLPLIAKDGSTAGLMGITRVLAYSNQFPDDYKQFREVMDYIQSHLAERIDIKKLAKISFLSDSQFRKRFRQKFHLSPQEFIIRTRLQTASRMLITSDEPLITVALKCGFTDQSYFTRQFSKFFEQSPGCYRSNWR